MAESRQAVCGPIRHVRGTVLHQRVPMQRNSNAETFGNPDGQLDGHKGRQSYSSGHVESHDCRPTIWLGE